MQEAMQILLIPGASVTQLCNIVKDQREHVRQLRTISEAAAAQLQAVRAEKERLLSLVNSARLAAVDSQGQ